MLLAHQYPQRGLVDAIRLSDVLGMLSDVPQELVVGPMHVDARVGICHSRCCDDATHATLTLAASL